MATIGSAKATLVNKIDSLTSSATAKDTIFLAKALKENTTHHSFTYQGAWATTTTYALDDVVTVNGNTYICVLSHVAPASFAVGSHWDVMATKGTDGTDGASGIPSGGSVGQVVTNTGAGAGGWADAAGGGKILQAKAFSIGPFHESVVNNGNNRQFTHMNGYNWQITPTESNSKILIMGDFYMGEAVSHYYFDMQFQPAGGSNNWVQPADDGLGGDGYTAVHRGGGIGDQIVVPFHYLHTHGVTAGTVITYRPHHAHWGARTVCINKYDIAGNVNAMAKSGVIFMEVSV